MAGTNYIDKLASVTSQKGAIENYWIKKLSGKLTKSRFPFDNDSIETTQRKKGTFHFQVTDNLFAALMKLSNKSDTRLHMVLLSSITALLYKYSRNKDIIIGTSIYKQDLETEFINTILTLRNRLEKGMTFKQLLLQMKNTLIEADKNQNYPVELILQKLGIPFSENEDFPIFDVMVLLENIQDVEYTRNIRLNILFSFLNTGDRLDAKVKYNASVFEEQTIKRICNHWINLMQIFLDNLNTLVEDVEILTQKDKKRLLEEFNNTKTEYPSNRTINQLFDEQAEKEPGGTALLYQTQEISYKELKEKSDLMAHNLIARGVTTGSIVAILAKRSPEMIISILAVIKAGGCYLPLDPANPGDRIHFVLSDSRANLLLAHNHLLDKINEKWRIAFKDSILQLDLDALCPVSEDFPLELPKVLPFSPVYIIYTSGSTGLPKGVIIQHQGLVNYIWWAAQTYVRGDALTFPLYTSIAFDLTVTSIFTPLVTGNSIVIYDDEDGELLVEKVIDDKRIGIIKLTPSHLKLLQYKSNVNSTIKRLIVGGEELTAHLATDIIKKFNNKVEIYNEYGPTETVVGSMTYKFDPQINPWSTVPIGGPIANTGIYILDNTQHLLPTGVQGELYISGHGVAIGYLNRPDLTHKAFINHPFTQGEKIYRSGDRAKWLVEGIVEFSGRMDEQLKIRGYRVEPGEIESRLSKHPAVSGAIITTRTDTEANTELVAYASKNPNNLDNDFCDYTNVQLEKEIKSYLNNQLPDYMVPTYIMVIDQFPLTINGKIDKQALPSPIMSIADYVPPSGPLEEQLATLWSEVLELPAQDISTEANFFEIGGHSLKAIILIDKIHKALDVKIPIAVLFKQPTIRGITSYIENSDKEFYVSIKQVEKKEYYPTSSAQKRLFFLQQMVPQGITYNLPIVLKMIVEDQNREAWDNHFELTFNRLIQRHESLRTSFHIIGEKPCQRVHESVDFKIERTDTADNFIKPFDLSSPPLLRVRIANLKEDTQLFMIDMHHIITDGTSMAIIMNEFMELFREKELPPLAIQYKDFSQWQNQEKGGEILLKQEDFWKKQFDGDIPLLNLPTDFPRPPVQEFQGKRKNFEIKKEETIGLNNLARAEGTTLYTVLLSIYYIFISKLSNQEDIVVGTPTAGRRHADLEQTIGIFINTLALRNYPSHEKKYRGFLRELKERTLAAFENQNYQYENLVEVVPMSRDLSRNPLFDTMFILQNFDNKTFEIPGLKLSPYEFKNEKAKFDLTLTAMEAGEKMLFTLEYRTKLFTDLTAERFIQYFKKVISEVLEKQDPKISEIEILTEKERNLLLYEYNDTAAAYAREKTIHELFEEQQRNRPEEIALICKGEKLTYSELNVKADALAQSLSHKEVKNGTIVGLITERSISMIIGLLGILKAGAAYLPLDPEYPKERIKYILKQGNVSVLVVSGNISLQNKDFTFEGEIIDISAITPGVPNQVAPAKFDVPATNPAYVIFTSGSTGNPKGVVVSHRNALNFIKGMTNIIDFSANRTILALTTLSFDIFFLETLLPLSQGMHIVIGDENMQRDPRLIQEAISQNNVNMIQVTPSRLQTLTDMDPELTGLQNISDLMVGGEAFPPHLFEKVKEKFIGNIFNLYGPTETTVWSTAKEVSTCKPEGLTIGHPIANTSIYILNRQNQPQPIGVPGELVIGGDGVSSGYLDNVELTGEKYFPLPWAIEHQVYRTGDLARWLPNGEIEFLGRIDQQIKIRGFRVEPDEIEYRLLQHEKIKDAVVALRDGERGIKELCAFIVCDEEVQLPTIREHLSLTLPHYMIPSYFWQLEDIPLTPNGKVDRNRLFENSKKNITVEKELVAPRFQIERQIAEVWKKVLKIDTIGINSNFFELGGDSMKIILVSNQLKEVLGREVPVTTIFEYPSIRALARFLKPEEIEDLEQNDNQEVKRSEKINAGKTRLKQRMVKRKKMNRTNEAGEAN